MAQIRGNRDKPVKAIYQQIGHVRANRLLRAWDGIPKAVRNREFVEIDLSAPMAPETSGRYAEAQYVKKKKYGVETWRRDRDDRGSSRDPITEGAAASLRSSGRGTSLRLQLCNGFLLSKNQPALLDERRLLAAG
jgi:hypothetical protein